MFHQREVLNIQKKVGFVFNEHCSCSCSLFNVHVGKSLLLIKELSDMSLQTKRRWRMRSLYFKPEISLLSNHCFHHVMTIRPGMGVNECFCKTLFGGFFWECPQPNHWREHFSWATELASAIFCSASFWASERKCHWWLNLVKINSV